MTAPSLAAPADLLIAGYQRFVSPYKGFCCAYRAHTGRASCSSLGRRAIRTHGLFGGLGLLSERFRRCKASALALQSAVLSEAAGTGEGEGAAPTTPATPTKKSSCNVANATCCADVSACACLPFM